MDILPHQNISDDINKSPFDSHAPRSRQPPKYFKIIGNYRLGVLKFVVEALKHYGFHPAPPDMPIERIHVFWSRSFMKHFASFQPFQKVNFLPNMSVIGRKDYLHHHIMIASEKYGRHHFDFWPIGFNLPKDMDAFLETLRKECHPYILKPPLAARGEGIRIVLTADDVKPDDPYYKEKIPLAQKYLSNPLLFKGQFKMTFRLYVLFTSVDPLRLYVYKNGLVRICSEKYQIGEFENVLVHLTNWDLQKDNEQSFESSIKDLPSDIKRDGLRSDISSIFAQLSNEGVDVDKIWQDIQDLVAKSFLAVEKPLTSAISNIVRKRGSAFELLGYDILLDDQYKPWLLEVNHTPSLSPHTDLENQIKREMIHDLLHLVDIRRQQIQITRIIAENVLQFVKSTLPQTFDDQQNPCHQDCSDLSTSKEQTSNTHHMTPSLGKPPLPYSEDGKFLPQFINYLDIWVLIDTLMEAQRRGGWYACFPNEDSHKMVEICSLKNRTPFLVHLFHLKKHGDPWVTSLFTEINQQMSNHIA